MSEKQDYSGRWSDDLEVLTVALTSAQKHLRTLPSNPFEALRRIDAVRAMLKGAGVESIRSIETLVATLEAECVRLEVEFWGLLTRACAMAGWDLLGNTNRRLVNKALFVSQEGRTVKVEGLSVSYTPFVQALMTVLSGQLQDVMASEVELRSFLGLVNKAYDTIPRSGRECSLEAIYRYCLIDLQRPNFWRNPNPATFVGLSRPAFRYRLSEILRLGITTGDGRSISLGTTTMTKDYWEIYSPGEQRVVIAGRLSMTPDREQHGY